MDSSWSRLPRMRLGIMGGAAIILLGVPGAYVSHSLGLPPQYTIFNRWPATNSSSGAKYSWFDKFRSTKVVKYLHAAFKLHGALPNLSAVLRYPRTTSS